MSFGPKHLQARLYPRTATKVFGGLQHGNNPIFSGKGGLANNARLIQAIGSLANSFPLALTSADITAATATGAGGTGGGPIYQEFYALVFGLTGSATSAQTAAVGIANSMAAAFNPIFADLSAQDELLRQQVNLILQKLQVI